MTVTAVAELAFTVFQMAVHLSFKGAVKQILKQRRQYPILAGKWHSGLQLFYGIRLELFIIK